MPINPGDKIVQIQIYHDVDGVYRAKFDGERVSVVSGLTLSASDKHAIAAAMPPFMGTASTVSVLNSTPPVTGTLAQLATA